MPLRDTATWWSKPDETPREIAQIDDQVMPISYPDNLISEPFVDGLARIQQEKNLAKQTAKDYAKKTRDKRLVATYLKSKFPDAFSKEMTVPEKEFPRLIKFAKRQYIGRIVAGSIALPTSIAEVLATARFIPPDIIGGSLFILGIAGVIVSAVLIVLSSIVLYDGE